VQCKFLSLVNQQLFGQYIPNTNKRRILMTTITNQENIGNMTNNMDINDETLTNKVSEANQAKERQTRIHTFLSNISNKLGLSNAIYFK